MAKYALFSDTIGMLPEWFKRVSIALAGGLVAGGALPRLGWWPLIFASVYLLHLSIRGLGFWRGTGIGFIGGMAFYASQSTWMSAYLGPEPWLALAILEGGIFALGMGAAAFVWQHLTATADRFGKWAGLTTVVSLSAIWVSREWVACHWPYGGYQWSRLGQPLASTPFASLAYFGGISLVSFFVVAASISLLVLPKATVINRGFGAIPVIALLIAATVAPALINGNMAADAKLSKSLQVTAVQGNANAGLFANPVAGSILEKHISATSDFINKHPQIAGSYGFTVWPENASDVDPLTNPLASAALHRVSNAIVKQPLVFGAVTHRGVNTYNSVLVYRPQQNDYQIYDKRRPVPFGEYVPDRALWRPLAPDLIDLIWRGFTPGKRAGVLTLSGTKVGSLICFEIGIDEITHDLVTGGSTIILSQANNSDFGHTDEAFQQEALVRLQAISSGRPIVHVSTVATTEIVSPSGELLAGPVQPFEPGAISHRLAPSTAITPAMKFFGWVDWVSGFLGTSVLIWGVIASARRRRDFRKLSGSVSNLAE
jgi:apolipoprotein N-acyltransferase